MRSVSSDRVRPTGHAGHRRPSVGPAQRQPDPLLVDDPAVGGLDRRCVHLQHPAGHHRPVVRRDHLARAQAAARPARAGSSSSSAERAAPAPPASPVGNSAPARPPSSTRRNASRSLATTGVPGRHRLGEDHAERLAAGVRRDVEVDAAQHPRLVRLGDQAEEGDPVAQLGRHVLDSVVRVARPGHQQPQPGPVRRRAPRTRRAAREALARLGEPAEEAERAAAPGAHSPGQPGSGSAPANRATATPLGISTAPPSRCSTCTLRASALTAIRAVIRSSTSWSTPCAAAQRPGPGHRGVEGGHHRAAGGQHGQQRQARRERLVHVQHVEVALGAASAAPGRPRPARRRAGPPNRCTAPAPPARPAPRTAAAASPRRPARAR